MGHSFHSKLANCEQLPGAQRVRLQWRWRESERERGRDVCIYTCIHIHIYNIICIYYKFIYIYIHRCTHTHIYIYIIHWHRWSAASPVGRPSSLPLASWSDPAPVTVGRMDMRMDELGTFAQGIPTSQTNLCEKNKRDAAGKRHAPSRFPVFQSSQLLKWMLGMYLAMTFQSHNTSMRRLSAWVTGVCWHQSFGYILGIIFCSDKLCWIKLGPQFFGMHRISDVVWNKAPGRPGDLWLVHGF